MAREKSLRVYLFGTAAFVLLSVGLFEFGPMNRQTKADSEAINHRIAESKQQSSGQATDVSMQDLKHSIENMDRSMKSLDQSFRQEDLRLRRLIQQQAKITHDEIQKLSAGQRKTGAVTAQPQ